jgi:hypothetical protein
LYAPDHGCAAGNRTGRSVVNIRELDEESRRTGVWPPRRIVLRVEREGDADEPSADAQRAAPVKLAEVGGATGAPPRPRAVPAPLPAPSLAPSVTPSRRPGLPGSRGVTPAPVLSAEDAAFEKWLAEPLAIEASEPEYQEPPTWLPDNVRVRAERRHRRVARKARTQLFGASAATTLAVGGCAAALSLIGLSQTEAVGGSLGVPSIGLFGTAPEPSTSNRAADTSTRTPATAAEPNRRPATRQRAPRRTRAAAPSRSGRGAAGASVARRTSSPSASRSPSQGAAAQPTQPARSQRRTASPPPPPARAPAPAPAKSNSTSSAPAVVWDAPSQPTASAPTAPSRPAPTAPSRPATSAPPTTSSPAP